MWRAPQQREMDEGVDSIASDQTSVGRQDQSSGLIFATTPAIIFKRTAINNKRLKRL
jgi:hypothetical protein